MDNVKKTMLLTAKKTQAKAGRGFTLVELLIAMTITLLLMAALGKSFALVGRTMKAGRSQVTLSSKLRSLSYRVRSDLRNRTTEARPRVIGSKEAGGYITYYEGPLTEQTWAVYGAEPIRDDDGVLVGAGSAPFTALTNNPTYRRFSRYGDFDDYLAFTAKAPGDSWFTGKVPRYMVDDTVALNPILAMEPTVIRSKYAEIIIWAEPEYQVDPATRLLVSSPITGMPLYKDSNNDYVPDSVTLHQRILLIRPDLNLRGNIGITPAGDAFESEFLRSLAGNVAAPAAVPAALENVYPIGAIGIPARTPYNPNYVDPTSDTVPAALFNSNWLVGMAPLHQFFDISLRRVVHPVTGEPTGYAAANSLEDLVEPHNRFGHVRYPGRYFGYGAFGGPDFVTSMPLLATAWNPAIITWNAPDSRGAGAVPAWFPTSYPNLTAQNVGIRTPLFNGFLIPHFMLGDPNPISPDGDHWQRGYLPAPDPRWDRRGEDVLANNVLAFDLKAFDETAPVFLNGGLDGAPGRAGVDDDGNGAIDSTAMIGTAPGAQITTELGAVGSDDTIVRVGDLAASPILGLTILDARDADAYSVAPALLLPRSNQMIATAGDFVDLDYPYLAGGPLLDLSRLVAGYAPATVATPALPVATLPASLPPGWSLANSRANFDSLLQSSFSGYPIDISVLSPLKSSGKLVHAGTPYGYHFMQPCFDTWTTGYESDGFDQTQSTGGAVGGTAGTVWVLYDVAGFAKTPRLPVGAVAPPALSIDTAQHDPTAPECLPPVLASMSSISITIRLEDPASKEMSQIGVIENLID